MVHQFQYFYRMLLHVVLVNHFTVLVEQHQMVQLLLEHLEVHLYLHLQALKHVLYSVSVLHLM